MYIYIYIPQDCFLIASNFISSIQGNIFLQCSLFLTISAIQYSQLQVSFSRHLSVLSTILCLEVVFSHKLNISLLHSAVMYTTTLLLNCLKMYMFDSKKCIPLLHSAMIYTSQQCFFIAFIIISSIPSCIPRSYHLLACMHIMKYFLNAIVISSTATGFVPKASKYPLRYSRFKPLFDPFIGLLFIYLFVTLLYCGCFYYKKTFHKNASSMHLCTTNNEPTGTFCSVSIQGQAMINNYHGRYHDF